MGKIYTIAPGIPFLKTLASGILQKYGQNPQNLAKITIFLPTNRACHALQDAFLHISGGKPLLLPKLKTIGAIDEEELSLTLAGHSGLPAMLNIPPAIDPIKRQILLARLIKSLPSRAGSEATAMQLAAALAALMDQIHTEGLSLANLKNIVPDEFAKHWQITLDFFQILETSWPQILAEEGLIDPADRRDRLIRTLTRHWQEHPPPGPIIAAGSTGSIPATAEFLNCIANLPGGAVILPGLDLDMPENDWNRIEPNHPQHGLKQTLTTLGSPRETVQNWNTDAPCETSTAREVLAREIMRPDDTTEEWTTLPQNPATIEALKTALQDLTLIETKTQLDEATTIAILLRETLETENKTATLITPDRSLARQVAAICARWNIQIDDSSGMPLLKTPEGLFAQLILAYITSDHDPVRLLALLKHPLCTFEYDPLEKDQALWELEKNILRGPEKTTLHSIFQNLKTIKNTQPKAAKLLETLEPVLTHNSSTNNLNKKYNINQLIENHIYIYNALTGHMTQPEEQTSPISLNPTASKPLQTLFQKLSQHAVLFNKMTWQDYSEIFSTLTGSETVRDTMPGHPRLKILGQIEARTLHDDHIIMAGLNEDMWPAGNIIDPWMSQNMRQDFGLPTADQYISLAAHDFVQGLCTPHITITRSEKATSGEPTIPSRWIQRLKAIATAANIPLNQEKPDTYITYAQHINRQTNPIKLQAPTPKPLTSLRPKQLSVTAIETLLKDPYSIYARHILKLKKLEDLQPANAAALKGTIVHDCLDKLLKTHIHPYPKTAISNMMGWAKTIYDQNTSDPYLWSFWSTGLHRAFSDTIKRETTWQKSYKPLKTEEKGQLKLSTNNHNFTLTARADRIDVSKHDPALSQYQKAAIIDYKTGGNFTKKGLSTGQHPQLPLEALILSEGGFQNIPAMPINYLGYWHITSSTNAGKTTALTEDIETLISDTKDKLTTLITTFADENTPYLSIPNPANAPRYNDYLHLSRIAEWSANEGEGDV